LVTGATGFVGTALVKRLRDAGRFVVRVAVRLEASSLPLEVEHVLIGDLTTVTVWPSALAGVGAVVHLAARVHVMRDSAIDPLVEFRRVNVEGTLNLARQAAAAGVRRFIFLSTVKVNGEGVSPTRNFQPLSHRERGAYKETDLPGPEDAYGISKHEAEVGLSEIAAETGMEVVIIRPPLVYGPGVKANFHALLRAVARRIPLPFGAIHNRRSLVALDNLVDLIITCINHPAAANQTFLVSDGEDLSTTELIRRMACALGRSARLIPVPRMVLMAGATLLGKREVAQRLCGSLQVDITKAREVLGWTPPVSVDEGLRRTAEHYLQQQ
jgi:nucleoside-diphosphate-sugar epimerase